MNFFRIHFLYLVIFGTCYLTVFAQTNGAQNITAPPTANNFAYPQSVFVDSHSGHIWVTDFDNNRVLRFDVYTLTSVDEIHTSSSPSNYFLGQNYPNPFNSSTQIMFSNSSTGAVLLEIFNLLGQKISTLFNEAATANTIYSIPFEAKNLPSGIYLYSLRTPNGSEVKKMCLLK